MDIGQDEIPIGDYTRVLGKHGSVFCADKYGLVQKPRTLSVVESVEAEWMRCLA
jgi:hypothetical protein